MSDYAFYAGMLRFVARKTEAEDVRMRAMMSALLELAAEVEAAGRFSISGDELEITARAFAGIAAFLQKQILPEVVAAQNKAGETQVRWAVDTSMDIVNRLLSHSAQKIGGDCAIVLPAAP